MLVNLERAIKSITETIGFFQPLYESIINSFQANADEVQISFIQDVNKNILGYMIKDNGEGFTNDSLMSYITLWSDYKVKQGALGSGRIMCLKVFDNIIIESQTKDNKNSIGNKVNFIFNRNFNANSIDEIPQVSNSSNTSYTITRFEDIREDYLKVNGVQYFDIVKIKEDIFIKLLPMFIRFKDDKKKFNIKISEQEWLSDKNLNERFDELKFESKSFDITKDLSQFDKDDSDIKNEKTYTFNLFYRLEEDKHNSLEQFYGAADRYITAFSKGVRLEKLKDGYSGIFCLTSKYFEEDRVKDSRNAFIIGFNENNANKDNPITFPEINDYLEKILNEILEKKFPEVREDLQVRKNKLIDQFPHLTRYISKIDTLTMSEANMLKKAEDEFFSETKKVRKEVEAFTKELQKGKNKFDEKRFQDITKHFTEVGREQLADYIGYRQTIVDMLLEIYDETQEDSSRFDEKDIHTLFMPMATTSKTTFNYANNVWIFDDKFMSYNYAASDKTIAQIVIDVEGLDIGIEEYVKNKKPDLVMFYSDSEDEYKDVLLIEFKRLNDGIDGKAKAINQINRYPMYIEEHVKNIRSIYTYTILDIDDEFIKDLKKVHLFQENAFGDHDNRITAYYKYNPEVRAHINVVSFSQVLQDANKRNKVFLDILKQNFEIKN